MLANRSLGCIEVVAALQYNRRPSDAAVKPTAVSSLFDLCDLPTRSYTVEKAVLLVVVDTYVVGAGVTEVDVIVSMENASMKWCVCVHTHKSTKLYLSIRHNAEL